jgi:hypothetical protein
MYRWIDAHGSITYSNRPPSDASLAQDLTIVDSSGAPEGSPHAPAARMKVAESANAAEPHVPTVGSVLEEFNRSAAAAAESPESEIAIAPPPPDAPIAVRDPCLRSADPACIERHKAAYVPYRGYAPDAAKGVGATASAAGGTLSGGSAHYGPVKLVAPKASHYALPPGNELPPPRTATR